MVKCRCGSWKLATFDAKHCHCLRETKVFGFRGKYGCRPPGELKTGRPPQPQYTCGECVVLCYYRANTGLPPTCLLLVDWVNCGNSMSERTHCDDDLTGLLSPSRQPSVADVSTGGRKSLLVEANCFGWFSHQFQSSEKPNFLGSGGTMVAGRNQRSNEGAEKPTLRVPCRHRSAKPFTNIWNDVYTLGTSRSSMP